MPNLSIEAAGGIAQCDDYIHTYQGRHFQGYCVETDIFFTEEAQKSVHYPLKLDYHI